MKNLLIYSKFIYHPNYIKLRQFNLFLRQELFKIFKNEIDFILCEKSDLNIPMKLKNKK